MGMVVHPCNTNYLEIGGWRFKVNFSKKLAGSYLKEQASSGGTHLSSQLQGRLGKKIWI
jgi:hypothetical protein